ncbi:GntR family transcriptional regulator [Shouchella clausii]|uniref:GntR family transcriptional regulator n=1 Tax=Shouchella clausii TaxID=79880 RepID=UPI0020B249EE|nr:GntR family transcriptional regulator [Shouchella clausii]MCY1106058.1 GntR family transcriptional regulator [Shouchella clausii]MEB5478774.1 GntR family transcriptional regulator [Shouchella clausii]MED4159706.1 GntR family transcriptional regulator [Shouchella clausii]MED4177753.1 GntR family transcriptional regulator [Shouchella clausii]
MKIEINRHSDIPIAQQIQENIADRIRSNLLEEGSKLPSVRKLAEQTGVSLMTANKAYNHLDTNAGKTDIPFSKGKTM